VPDGGRTGGAAGVVVVGPGHDVVLEAVVVDVEEAGAMVPLPTVPESAEPLPHDARRTLAATTAVTAIPFLMGPWFH
jgi:sugar (pentulose or hexulose) kinase